MILDNTNFAILHEGLNFSKYVPVDKHIINQHIFNGGLTVEIDENFLPRYGFKDFEEYAPNVNNLAEALKSLWFVGRKHYERLISFVTLSAMISGDEKKIVEGLHLFVDYVKRTHGNRYAFVLYAENVLKEKERFLKYCSDNKENYFEPVENNDEYYEAYRTIQYNYGHIVTNRPDMDINEYIDTLPYTSNHDIVFDFYRKTYTSSHASSRDDLCNILSLYGWTTNGKPNSFSPNVQHGVIDVPKTAHLNKFQQFVDALIVEELEKTNVLFDNNGKEILYKQKYEENLEIFGEKYLFTVMYANLIS